MSRPLSNDLRERIIKAKLRGESTNKIAKEKDVRRSTVANLWARYMETGSWEPKPNAGGRKPALSKRKLKMIRKAIKRQPDITLQELVDKLKLPVCISALCRTLTRLGCRYKKKTLYPSAQNSEDVRQDREEWQRVAGILNPKKLVFIDETGINTGMTRPYGRGNGGERVDAYVPDMRFESTTVISSVRTSGETVPLMFDGALNGTSFRHT